MAEPLRLLCIFAHPDDESLGVGGTLAKYAAEGVDTFLVTATRGQRGWFGIPEVNPGLDALGTIREGELRAAGKVLGLREVHLLPYVDGDLDQAPPDEALGLIVEHVRAIRPQVVLTFGLDGAYGHPDHVAISQLTNAALVLAADASYGNGSPHRVAKLYYMAVSRQLADDYTAAFGELSMEIDGVKREGVVVPDWMISAAIDARDHWQTVWRAASCHRTQLPGFESLAQLPPETHRELWGRQEFVRVFSLVNGGRQREHDLFDGLR